MIKIVTIIGARPQFIKAAAFSRVLCEKYDPVNPVKEILVHTGQHFDSNMSKVFFDELRIPEPDYNLGIHGGSHGDMTGKMIIEIEKVLFKETPDIVLVYGDTNSTLAGAISASKLNIPIVHVEAGLRSFNRVMPEEINRVMADHVSDLLFSPTKTASKNLQNEGIELGRICEVGDIMYDAALYYKKLAKKPDSLKLEIEKFFLLTIHRAENTDNPAKLSAIIEACAKLPYHLICPIHPRTLQKLSALNITVPDNLMLIEPVSYLEMVWLEVSCEAVITDSGGVQKEAFFHHKPCLTLREETEWVELCDLGVNILTGPEDLYSSYIKMSSQSLEHLFEQTLYGYGNTAELILNEILKRYANG